MFFNDGTGTAVHYELGCIRVDKLVTNTPRWRPEEDDLLELVPKVIELAEREGSI